MDLLAEIRRSPMGRFQLTTIAIALVLVILDGIDVATMAFAAPTVSDEWDMHTTSVGLLLSSGLFGMAAGSIFLAPLADRIGRRRLTIISLAIAALGMTLSVFAMGPVDLGAYRVITGIGVGGMLTNLIVLVSEYSSDKRRSSVIAFFAAGFPVGATLGGLIAGPLIPQFGWRSTFAVGAVLSIALVAVSIRMLPESLDFLVIRRPADALGRTNAILVKMNHPVISELPDVPTESESRSSIRDIIGGPMIVRTLALWVGYACLIGSYYFVNTWAPSLIKTASGDSSLGVTVGTIANAGGIAGCFVFGALATVFMAHRLLMLTLSLAAGTFVVFALIFHVIPAALVIAFVLGVLTTAAIAGFYALAPEVYHPRSRATGMGLTVGIGRLVSICAPILVGVLLDAGWGPENVFHLFAIPLLLAAVCVAILHRAMTKPVSPPAVAAADALPRAAYT